MGLFYGFGYCFLTDWHYEVRLKIGKNMSNSFIAFILNDCFGFGVDEYLIDVVTGITFFLIFFVSIFLNINNYFKNKD